MVDTTVHESAPTARAAGSAVRRRSRHRLAWLSALVAACTVAMHWLIMTPPLYYDPYNVFQAAALWPDIPLDQWPFNEVPHQVTRLGLVIPALLVQRVLGPGQVAYFVIAAFGGLVFSLGCYLAIRSLFGDVVGVSATLLLLVHPFFTLTNPFTQQANWSTGVILPDMPGAGLFAAGMAALVVASRREGRSQTRLLLAAGVCLGTAFLVREFLAFLYAAIPVFFWLLRIPWRRMVMVAAPMLGILGVNLVHNAVVWGDPLVGLRSAAVVTVTLSEPMTRLEALTSFVRAMHDRHPLGTVFIVLLVLNVVGWSVTRDRRLTLTLAWFLALWAPLTLQSGLLGDFSLRGWGVRYWFAVFPALLAGGFGSVVLVARRIRVPRVALGVVTALVGAVYVVSSALAVPDLPRDKAWGELRGWLEGRDELPVIWCDYRLGQILIFYTRSIWGEPLWHGEIRVYSHKMPALPPAAANGPFLLTPWPMVGGRRPNEATGWRLLWRSSDGLLELWER